MKTYSFLILESRLPFIQNELGGSITTKKLNDNIFGESMYEVIIPENKINASLLFGLFSAGKKYGEHLQQEISSLISNPISHE